MARKKPNPKPKPPKPQKGEIAINVERLWEAADKLRGTVDAADYKHVVLGLIFPKYISDSFAERRAQLEIEFDAPDGDDYIEDEAQRKTLLENRDEYEAENVFWVPR